MKFLFDNLYPTPALQVFTRALYSCIYQNKNTKFWWEFDLIIKLAYSLWNPPPCIALHNQELAIEGTKLPNK